MDLLYAVSAAIAGYKGTLGFAQIGIPSMAMAAPDAISRASQPFNF